MKKCHWNYQAHSIARSSRNILSEPLFYTIYHNTISNTLRTTLKLYIHKKNSTFVFHELWLFMSLCFSLEIARMTDNEWVYFSISMSLTEFQLKLMRRGRCLSTHTKLIVAPLVSVKTTILVLSGYIQVHYDRNTKSKPCVLPFVWFLWAKQMPHY